MNIKPTMPLLLVLGLILGLILTELGLRVFVPELLTGQQSLKAYISADKLVFEPGKELHVKSTEQIKDGDKTTKKIQFNDNGHRDAKDISSLKEEDWIVYGGTVGFGIGVDSEKWFGNLYENKYEPVVNVYNATLIGGSRYFLPMVESARKSGAKPVRAVFVIDLNQHPDVLLNQLKSFNDIATEPDVAELSFLQKSALAIALGLALPPQQEIPETLTRQQASKIADAFWPALEPYAQKRQHNVVLFVPARGYWLDNSFGTAHRKNHELIASAFRAKNNIYAVDVSYMMRENYINPIDLYYDNGRLKPEGQKMLADGWQKQVVIFTDWQKSDD